MPCAFAGTTTAAIHNARTAPSRLRLLQQRVKEAVMRLVRKNLAREMFCVRMGPGEFKAPCAAMTFDERAYLFIVFLAKNRARYVEQFTITRKQLPKRVEDRALSICELRDVARSTQPLDVRMAPDDAGGRARHVRENAAASLAVPPRARA